MAQNYIINLFFTRYTLLYNYFYRFIGYKKNNPSPHWQGIDIMITINITSYHQSLHGTWLQGNLANLRLPLIDLRRSATLQAHLSISNHQ